MTLHKRESTRDELLDSVYAGEDLHRQLPTNRFLEREMRPVDAYQAVSDELMLDGNARQNLATFCQTWEEPEIHQLMELAIDKNMIDKDEYPQTAELERRCVQMLADLWKAPEDGTPVGCSAIGSSEACMLGGMAAKWRWREKRRAEGKPTDTPNMVCGPVQVVWHKFAKYWDVEMREIPMAEGRYGMDVEQMLERVDENTIMVVPTFGVTYTGAYEPVIELSKALDQLHQDTGLDIDIHVDGASGAFLAPFCAPDILWDFRVPRVKSISTSGHKFGLAPLGVGWVLWRDTAELPDDLIFHVTYLGGDMPVFQINFSRPAGQIVAQYYNFVRLGKVRVPECAQLVLFHRQIPGRRDHEARALRAAVRLQPADRHPHRHLAHPPGGGPRVHPLRPGRPAPGPRLAGPRLPAHRGGVGHLGPTHPGAPGSEPRPGLPAARRHEAIDRPLRQAPGERGHDQGGVRRVQPPLSLPAVAPGGPSVQPGWWTVQSTLIGRWTSTRGRPTAAGRSVVHGAGEAKVRPASPRRARS